MPLFTFYSCGYVTGFLINCDIIIFSGSWSHSRILKGRYWYFLNVLDLNLKWKLVNRWAIGISIMASNPSLCCCNEGTKSMQSSWRHFDDSTDKSILRISFMNSISSSLLGRPQVSPGAKFWDCYCWIFVIFVSSKIGFITNSIYALIHRFRFVFLRFFTFLLVLFW